MTKENELLRRSVEFGMNGSKGHGASRSSRSMRGRIHEVARFVVLLVTSLQVVSSDLAFADNVLGAWDSPEQDNWPFVPVHATLTPDGRVLTYGSNAAGKPTGFFTYDVWDPDEGLSGGHTTLQNMTLTDIFCSYAVILPTNGSVLIAGGDIWNGTKVEYKGNNNSNIFSPSDGLLTRGNDMKRSRWYATATPLMNGEIYIQGGKGGADVAEVRDVFGQFRTLTGVPTGNLDWWYPRNWLAPDGRVFGFDADANAYYVDPSEQGSMTSVGNIGVANAGRSGPSAMFRPGKILQLAGKNKNAVVIDINGPQPVVTPTESLSARRIWASLTVLPDGKVLATGGSGVGDELVDVTNYAEIWDPQTGHWTHGAEGSRARLYHSVALLLPDASVLVAGGGASNLGSPVDQLHGEIYYPPYFFDTSGGFAARPVIESAPQVLEAGQSFTIVADPSEIDRVTLVGAGAATHAVNLQQRFVELAFSATGNSISAEMPARATDTPPGYYLLFVVNDAGVPSRAKIVRVNIRQEPPPPPPPPPPPMQSGGGGATGLDLLVLLGLFNVLAQRKRNTAGA